MQITGHQLEGLCGCSSPQAHRGSAVADVGAHFSDQPGCPLMGGKEQGERAAQADGARIGALQRGVQQTLRDQREQH